ncbi:hypothetical protein [Legionella gratiana]|nr:hypothetical protein [Legionella gratiana]
MDNKIMLPIKVFYTFPYANGDALRPSNSENITQPPLIDIKDKQFSDLSADELNNLPYEKFVELADIPMKDETPTHISKEWEFAANIQVNETKRGIFIDRLAVSNEQDVIPRFLKMYQEAKNSEIRDLHQLSCLLILSHQETAACAEGEGLLNTVAFRKSGRSKSNQSLL